ncbi:hypothetical protein HD554DRAFT_1774958 [Boletus coccyginus]|nr:hypothetical protein HD554DRAFT_1774958 [Boletus coccyginus]
MTMLPPSLATSIQILGDQATPPGSSPHVPQSSDVCPVASPPEAPPGEHLNSTKSPQRSSMFKRKSRRLHLANSRSRSRSPTRVNALNKGPPRMAEGKRRRRAVVKFPTKLQGRGSEEARPQWTRRRRSRPSEHASGRCSGTPDRERSCNASSWVGESNSWAHVSRVDVVF